MKEIKKHIHGITAALLFFVGGLTLLILAGFTTPLPLPEEKAIVMDFSDPLVLNHGNADESDNSESDSGEKSTSSEKFLNQDFEDSQFEESGNSEENLNLGQDKINNLFNNPFGTSDGGENEGDDDNPDSNGKDLTPGDLAGKLDPGRKVTKVVPELEDNLFGTVLFEITVNAKGSVVDIRLVSTTCNECVESAKEAVKKWKFDAISKEGLQIGTVKIEIKQN